ncbi:MAG TPA: pyridoxal phosphate-dependent aminotransferase [Thermomicrobiales bacterium]|nr:pyridoxal phosphate-dependent aminotransferase [Thermomicrobiales bacterium]
MSVNIFDLFELAQRKPEAISLGLGDPDLPTPPHIVAAAAEAIRDGRTGPAPATGLPELRAVIARKLARDNGVEVDAESEVLVTTGGQEALFLLVQALIEPGDEIIVPDPRYTSYDEAIELAGGSMVLVPTRPEDDFALDPDEVAKRITPRTKVLLLISPNNPTAGVIPPDWVRRLATLAAERDLVVIADEIYEKFVYDDARHLSVASLPGMAERTITLNGVSKTYAMTGWRIGYLAAPASFIQAATALKEMVNVQAPTVSQWAAAAALDGPQECVEAMRQTYDARRRMMMAELDRMGLSYGRPRGGLYIWANVASSGLTATELSYYLLAEEDVLVLPGAGFGDGWDDWIRMTILQPEDTLREVAARMAAVIGRHGR